MFTAISNGRGISLAFVFACCFVGGGGCSPSVFHIFIGFATVFIDFLAFALFPLSFSLVFLFSSVFSLVFVDFSTVFDCSSLVFVMFPCFSMLLFGLLVYLGCV